MQSKDFINGYLSGLHDARLAVHTIGRMLPAYLMTNELKAVSAGKSIIRSSEHSIEQLKLKVGIKPNLII